MAIRLKSKDLQTLKTKIIEKLDQSFTAVSQLEYERKPALKVDEAIQNAVKSILMLIKTQIGGNFLFFKIIEQIVNLSGMDNKDLLNDIIKAQQNADYTPDDYVPSSNSNQSLIQSMDSWTANISYQHVFEIFIPKSVSLPTAQFKSPRGQSRQRSPNNRYADEQTATLSQINLIPVQQQEQQDSDLIDHYSTTKDQFPSQKESNQELLFSRMKDIEDFVKNLKPQDTLIDEFKEQNQQLSSKIEECNVKIQESLTKQTEMKEILSKQSEQIRELLSRPVFVQRESNLDNLSQSKQTRNIPRLNLNNQNGQSSRSRNDSNFSANRSQLNGYNTGMTLTNQKSQKQELSNANMEDYQEQTDYINERPQSQSSRNHSNNRGRSATENNSRLRFSVKSQEQDDKNDTEGFMLKNIKEQLQTQDSGLGKQQVQNSIQDLKEKQNVAQSLGNPVYDRRPTIQPSAYDKRNMLGEGHSAQSIPQQTNLNNLGRSSTQPIAVASDDNQEQSTQNNIITEEYKTEDQMDNFDNNQEDEEDKVEQENQDQVDYFENNFSNTRLNGLQSSQIRSGSLRQNSLLKEMLKIEKVEKEEKNLGSDKKNQNIQENPRQGHSSLKYQQNLSKDKKQTVIFFNELDQNILIGQNDTNTLVFDENLDFLSNVDLGGELISIFPFEDQIYCGLNNNYLVRVDKVNIKGQQKKLNTREVVQKIVHFYYEEQINNDLIEYLILLEKDGHIEFLDIQTFTVVFQYQHTSKLSIQDGVQIVDKNELCLGLAQLTDGSYKDGKLSFIRINFSVSSAGQLNRVFVSSTTKKYDITINELSAQDQSVGKAVFNVRQISANQLIFTVIDKNFKLYNRQKDTIVDIANPSRSINYNSLIPIDGFCQEQPYLLYKDSRSIGVIDCLTYEAKVVDNDVQYSRCGNLYSLEQYRDSKGCLNLLTFIFDRTNNERKIKSIIVSTDRI